VAGGLAVKNLFSREARQGLSHLAFEPRTAHRSFRLRTSKVRPEPGLLVKSSGRSAPGLPKQNFTVSSSRA
jgi:hypothetical protein